MTDSRPSECEDDVESVPQIIDDDYFKIIQVRAETVIRDLREQEQYQIARDFIRLYSVTENLFLNIKDEQEKVRSHVEQHVDATGRIEEAVRISQKDRSLLMHRTKENWKSLRVSTRWKRSLTKHSKS